MKITLVAGARPNFMKIAPIIKSLKQAAMSDQDIEYRLVHTGQHYDDAMSGNFFRQLEIPEPDINLCCKGSSQAEQTASIMIGFETELILNKPDLVLVVGDVNSTMACTIAAKKLCIDTAHVEAGIRSGDMSMPEEINRMVTDSISDLYFTTSVMANETLVRQHIAEDKIHFVGNTMIDTLMQQMNRIQKPSCWDEMDTRIKGYMLLTLHRPSNVDDPVRLQQLFDIIQQNAAGYDIVFPIHPRTRKNIETFGIETYDIKLIDPQGYLEFIFLLSNAIGVITDSGGVTEEATVLDIPCITLRNTTERPETVIIGTNELVGEEPLYLAPFMSKMLNGSWKKGSIPEKWDGKASDRIVEILQQIYKSTTYTETGAELADML